MCGGAGTNDWDAIVWTREVEWAVASRCVGDSGRKWVLHPDDVGAVDQSGVGSESDRYWCPF